jgi:hypothetical protein
MALRGQAVVGAMAVSWRRMHACATVTSVRRTAQDGGSNTLIHAWRASNITSYDSARFPTLALSHHKRR